MICFLLFCSYNPSEFWPSTSDPESAPMSDTTDCNKQLTSFYFREHILVETNSLYLDYVSKGTWSALSSTLYIYAIS